MYCLDHAERPHHCNFLSFTLHELVFSGIIRSSLHICTVVKLLNNHTLLLQYRTVWMHSDKVFPYSSVSASPGASRMKTYKNNPNQLVVVLYKPLSLWIRQPDKWNRPSLSDLGLSVHAILEDQMMPTEKRAMHER